MAGLTISSAFDGGNIRVLSRDDPQDVELEIKQEPYTAYDKRSHFQWFFFRVSGCRGRELVLHIVNAGRSSFPEAWPGYSAVASADCADWFRVPTTYDAATGRLTLRYTPERDSVYFAYFAPYPWQRHQELVAGLQGGHPARVALRVLGQTLQGRDIDMLRIGEPGPGKKAVWVVARQHPGETMAEWLAEGLLQRLVDRHDPLVDHVLRAAVFYCVPNACPDGSVLGHLRTNSEGANLNRCWQNPQPDYCPEVHSILKAMDATGCDLFLDVHGDEEVTYNFVSGEEGIPSYSATMAAQQRVFVRALQAASPDFKPTNFYAVDAPGQAEMAISTNAVGERFGCLALTLELPFKDVQAHPDWYHGWSPQRSKHFGRVVLQALHQVLQAMAGEDVDPSAGVELGTPRKRKKQDLRHTPQHQAPSLHDLWQDANAPEGRG